MKKSLTLFVMVILFGYSVFAAAEEKSGHFKGKPSETLEEALGNFSEYNQKLSQIISQKTLSPVDMQHVHELTYTLENALEKINATMTELAVLLEAVHVGSESGDTAATQKEGLRYLDIARQIIK
ncbi:MAG: hypothetical protein KF908_02185 [Nitrosomonas sp.]|nr:hypothetical protein [Nitrosomonas sp.]MCW5606855.1 hypothetical protein [Nitrosomonas sp.]